MKRIKSTFKLHISLTIGIIFLSLNSLVASEYTLASENRVLIKTTQFVTNMESVVKSTSLLSLTPITFNQDPDEEEKPKEVKSKKKWYITAGTLIVSSVSAYLLLMDKGNGKAKIPGPPSRPANP